MEQARSRKSLQPPWLFIWIHPRSTLRHIINTDPQLYVTRLAAISGITQALDNASDRAFGDRYSLLAILALCFIVGSIGGIISLHIGGVVFNWAGRLFGGKGQPEQIRAALAWASIPDVVLLAIYLPLIAMFGHNWFISSTNWADQSDLIIPLITVLGLVGVAAVVWRVVLLVQCLAEAHGFSAWRSLGTVVVGTLTIGIPLFILFTACR